MFTTPRKVRDVMGLGEDETLNDREMEVLIRIASDEIKNELFTYHYNEEIQSNPHTGASWDGSNTIFQTNTYPIMDIDMDFNVSNSDVSVRWLDSTYTQSSASWSIRSNIWGLVNIYQSDGVTAIPGSAETVCIDYYSCSRSYTRRQLEDLTAYLAAHLTQSRLTGATSISLADFQKNIPLILKSNTDFLMNYRRLLSNLQGDSVKGV